MRWSRRFALGALTGLVLAACGAPSPGTDPQSTVQAIYAPYVAEQASMPPLKDAAPWTADVRAMLTELEKAQAGDDYGLGFDPFIDGMDYEIANLEVTMDAPPEAGAASVRASFTNFGEPVVVVYDLMEQDGGWRVNDVHTEAWALRALLADRGLSPPET